MDFLFLVMEKSWKINVEKLGGTCTQSMLLIYTFTTNIKRCRGRRHALPVLWPSPMPHTAPWNSAVERHHSVTRRKFGDESTLRGIELQRSAWWERTATADIRSVRPTVDDWGRILPLR